jgi:hypothetical protein
MYNGSLDLVPSSPFFTKIPLSKPGDGAGVASRGDGAGPCSDAKKTTPAALYDAIFYIDGAQIRGTRAGGREPSRQKYSSATVLEMSMQRHIISGSGGGSPHHRSQKWIGGGPLGRSRSRSGFALGADADDLHLLLHGGSLHWALVATAPHFPLRRAL